MGLDTKKDWPTVSRNTNLTLTLKRTSFETAEQSSKSQIELVGRQSETVYGRRSWTQVRRPWAEQYSLESAVTKCSP
jgi:hypothetical protein